MAIVTTLFYLKAAQVNELSIANLKKDTRLGVSMPKGGMEKENLAVIIGKELFTKGLVKRKDERNIITKGNLIRKPD